MEIVLLVLVSIGGFLTGWTTHHATQPRPKIIQVERLEVKELRCTQVPEPRP